VLLVSGDRHHAEALREQVSAVIAPLGLRLAPGKTRVVHIDEGFDFLGFHIRRMRKRGTNKHYVYTTPSRASVQKARNRVRERTYRSTLNRDLDELITSVNRFLRGWANYFRHGGHLGGRGVMVAAWWSPCRGPAARCATPIPATTKSTDRRRSTGGLLASL